MADADFDEFDAYGYEAARGEGPERSARMQGWINGAGAATSLALILGLGLWGYDLAVRDVEGVPVIKALEGPARMAPEDPGGTLAVHQGMAVNEIAADGTAAAAADSLTLAPRTGGLTDDDLPMARLSPEIADPAPAPEADEESMAGLVPAAPVDAPTAPMAAAPSIEPLPDGPADPVLDVALAPADAIPSDVPGVAQSLRPQLRPGDGAVVASAAGGTGTETGAYDAMAEAAAAAVAEALSPQDLDVAAGSLPAGTRLVQIGAFPRESDARLQWDKTAQRFGALLDGKRRVIERATSGGSEFYRLRVEGFSDIDDAQRFCAGLKAEGAECVPAVVR